jgi:acyl carrier protein
MDGHSVTPIRRRLIEIVEQLLARRAAARRVSAEDTLADIGVDSLGMVNLMLAVEAEFNIMIASTDITPENLRSVASIEALIMRQTTVVPS